MKEYFIVQIKRTVRLLPYILAIAITLSFCAFFAYQSMASAYGENDQFDRIRVATVGTADDQLMEIGISALQSIDSSRMSIELIQMDKTEAENQLIYGHIDAYIVFPEGFIEDAMHGNIRPLHFVSCPGNRDMLAIFKDEVTKALGEILMASERGTFALADVMREFGYGDAASDQMNRIALEYAMIILQRDDMYEVELVGAADGMTFTGYIASGLSTILLFLLALPFASVLILEDDSLIKQLYRKGVGVISQSICEFTAFWFGILIIVLLPCIILADNCFSALAAMIPSSFCVCAVCYLLYSLCRNYLGGVMLQLLVALFMCFMCGCMYPVHFFPVKLQRIAAYFPAALVRNQISKFFGETLQMQYLPLIAWGIVCFSCCVGIRYWHIARFRRGS